MGHTEDNSEIGKNEDGDIVKQANRASLATSRRQFAKTMAVIAATPLLPGLGAALSRAEGRRRTNAQGPWGANSEGVPGEGSMSTDGTEFLAQTPREGEKPGPDVEALTEYVRVRYGKNLNDEQLGEVRRSLNQRVRGADRLKQFKLANADEPAFVFSASPDEAE